MIMVGSSSSDALAGAFLSAARIPAEPNPRQQSAAWRMRTADAATVGEIRVPCWLGTTAGEKSERFLKTPEPGAQEERRESEDTRGFDDFPALLLHGHENLVKFCHCLYL
jgi:hypothetical protein